MSDHEDILDGLEERLQKNAKAFESLLALTPAQEYYGTQIVDGRDPSEQWRAKKQTKEEKRAAKKAKLDPANQKSALDVMKERERKRKRELGMDDEENAKDGANVNGEESGKRQKVEEDADTAEARRRQKADKRKEKRERKKAKVEKVKAKRDAKKVTKKTGEGDDGATSVSKPEKASQPEDEEDVDGSEDDADDAPGDMEKLDMSGLADTDEEPSDSQNTSTAPSSPAIDSPAFDMSANHSTASSSSSIIPPSAVDEVKADLPDNKTASQTKATSTTQKASKPKLDAQDLPNFSAIAAIQQLDQPASGTSSPKPQLPTIDPEALQSRLRQRIEELRARRKADGADGQPARTRQDLLDQRRKKEELRKAHKKELRRKSKEEEAKKQEERLRGSGSPLATPDIFSPKTENNFSFSRLAFEDGTAADASLSKLVDARKKKGPQDARTALQAAENKERRVAGYDDAKRADIVEKDLWLNANKRVHGERVRDDTSLLKKALKRKEKAKGKSEKEWKEREHAVVRGKELKQKKRETNLQTRREQKGTKGGKGPKKSGGKSGGKNGGKGGGGGGDKKRAGFEGRFKA